MEYNGSINKRKETIIKPTEMRDAVNTVNDAIKQRTLKLQSYLQIEDNDPVMLEGTTVKGYYCQLMVNPKDVVRIMIDYNFAMYAVLEEDAPTAMWDDIAAWYGLGGVSSVDI